MGRPLDEDIIIKILERWQKAFKENSHYVSASDLSLVIKDVRELPTIQSVATDICVGDTISRQAAIDAIDKALSRTFIEPCGEMILKDLPSAQPEIVRCKDCRWRKDQSGSTAWLPCRAIVTPSDFYCGRAERRTDG